MFRLLLSMACLGAAQAGGIPLFVVFDGSPIDPLLLNSSTALPPWVARETFVWGADNRNPARLAAWRAHVPHATLSYYMPYSRAPAANMGFPLSFWLEHHPDWVLYRCDRKSVAFWDGQTAPTGSVPLDFTNPDVVEWQVRNQSVHAQQLGYGAMAFDNVGGGTRQGANSGQACGVVRRDGTWSPRFNQSNGTTYDPRQQPAFREASIVWLERTAALMKKMTPSLGVVPNQEIGPDGWGASDEGQRVLAASTAVLSERGFTAWSAGKINGQELLAEYAWMAQLAAQGKQYYSINEVNTDAGAAAAAAVTGAAAHRASTGAGVAPPRSARGAALRADAAVNDTWAEWVVGAFLVGMQANSSALWLGGPQHYGNWSHTSAALDAPIGEPLGSNYTALPDDGSGLLFRNFSGGVAVINPSLVPAQLDVGPGGRRGFRDLFGRKARGGELLLAPQTTSVLLFAE